MLVLDTVIYLVSKVNQTKKEKISKKMTYEKQNKQEFILDKFFLFEEKKRAEIHEQIASLLENISLLSLLTPLYQCSSHELNSYAKNFFPGLYEECLKNVMNIKLSH